MRILILTGLLALVPASGWAAETTADLNFPLIRLPSDFRSQRVTRRASVPPGKTLSLFDFEGPGCVRHFWITLGGNGARSGRPMHLRITTDGATQPQVDMRLDRFFGLLLDQGPYRIDSAAIKLLPANAFNCYLPISFSKSCRMTLTNNHDDRVTVYSMVDAQQYKNPEGLTPYRFHAVYHEAMPAEKRGSFLMADVGGRGFVAGFFYGVRQLDSDDSWYHNGGDLWLLDGETDPHALRGVGGEDVFGYSFGLHESCYQWTGTPYHRKAEEGQPTEIVAYRFFGVDPIPFKSSLVLRFGTRANDTQSVVYYYRHPSTAVPTVDSPKRWTILGPFACRSAEDFARAEFPEKNPADWPASWQANFGQYRRKEPATFRPVETASEHTWVDFTRHLRPFGRANPGTQPAAVSAYATTMITCEKEGAVNLLLGYDDWLKLWVNGELVAQREHNRGIATDAIPAMLRPGENRILLKLSNSDNEQWRLWAFSFRVQKREP